MITYQSNVIMKNKSGMSKYHLQNVLGRLNYFATFRGYIILETKLYIYLYYLSSLSRSLLSTHVYQDARAHKPVLKISLIYQVARSHGSVFRIFQFAIGLRSLLVSIFACHAGDFGSKPGSRRFFFLCNCLLVLFFIYDFYFQRRFCNLKIL